jgi:mannose-6-phosphate isomerase-like protein (cupin superfamily)
MRTNPAAAATDQVTVTLEGGRSATWALGSLFQRLLNADSSGGALGASVVTQPPGLASPLHVHTREAEAWFLLDGTLTYRAGTELVDLAAGDFIYLPRDVPHAFRITGTTPARYLALSLPGQLLDLYDELGTPATTAQLPDGGIPAADIQRWTQLAAQYGIRIVGPPIPDAAPHA